HAGHLALHSFPTRRSSDLNFGMAHPEGYRKAMRLMRLAAKFGAPVITLVDTPGAYPGLGAEERGQAEAIASSLIEMASLKTPIIDRKSTRLNSSHVSISYA